MSAAGAGFAAPANGNAAAPQSYVTTSSGVSLFYRDWGTGKPVLFLHGWSMSSDFWQYQMFHLAAHGYRSIAYDRRGHGKSSDPGRGYDTESLAADLLAVIEKLNLRDVTLVGHSMAGGELIRYLTRYGSARISKLVLVGATTPFSLQTADNPNAVPREMFDRTRAAWLQDFPKWLADNAGPFFTPETSAATVDWAIRMSLQTSLQAVMEVNLHSIETDVREEARKVTVPTLIIHGDRDVSAPLDLTARRTAELIRGSRLKIYEGAPHGLPVTHKDRLNADLLEFLRA